MTDNNKKEKKSWEFFRGLQEARVGVDRVIENEEAWT